MRLPALLLASLWCAFAHATEVEGVQLPDVILTPDARLHLNGAALHSRAVFRIYVAALYLSEPSSDPDRILASSGAKRMLLVLQREIGARDFARSVLDGLRDNHAESELGALAPRTESLLGLIMRMQRAKGGTTIGLDYVPGTGTVVLVDGVAQGPPLKGADFYAALLRVWLGARPVSAALKHALLGLER